MQNFESQFSSSELTSMFSYLLGAAIIFVALFGAFLIVNKIVSRIVKRKKGDQQDRLRKVLRVPVLLLIIIVALWAPLFFYGVPEVMTSIINKSLSLLTITVLTWISILLIRFMKHFVLSKYDIGQKDNLKARKVYTQFRIIERILIFIILVIAISLALMTFDSIRKIGVTLITSAGITGIILGFAAQKILGGVLAGFQLAITQPIRIDDVVIVENEWGWIEEINLTYVVVRIWDKRRMVLPTTYFIEKPFQNWTRTTAEILGTVFIYTDYNVPFDEMRKELTRLLEECEHWDGKVNVLQVTNSTEKTVEVRALMSAADSPSAWDLRVFVREGLIKFLQKNYPESLPKSRVVISNESTVSEKDNSKTNNS